MATHATIPVDHDTKARFIRHVAAQQARSGRRVTHSAAINHLLDLVDRVAAELPSGYPEPPHGTD